MIVFLHVFRRRRHEDADAELDTHIAGAEMRLDEKRLRWIDWLLERQEQLQAQVQAERAPARRLGPASEAANGC